MGYLQDKALITAQAGGGYKAAKASMSSPAQSQALQLPGTQVAAGFSKSAISHGANVLSLLTKGGGVVEQGLDQTIGRIINAVSGRGFTPTATSATATRVGNALGSFANQPSLQPQGTAQNLGAGLETAAGYFIPSGAATRAERVVDTLSHGISRGLLAAGARIIGKGVAQGVSAGAINYAQTGGDLQSTKNVALGAGVTRGVLAGVGEAARAAGIPTRLYSVIFKNSKADMLQELNSNGIVALQKDNPDLYERFVREGLIKTGVGGTPTLNKTLAEKALDKGLRGGLRPMANEVVAKTLESESAARAIASNSTDLIELHPNVQKTLETIAAQYADVGVGQFGQRAQSLVNAIKQNGGKVDANTALDIRRLLDGLRVESSYNPNPTLSLQSRGLKELSDSVRAQVNSIPGMDKTMKDYSFYLDAMEALAKEAARRGNSNVLGMIGTLFLGGAAANPGATVPLTAVELGRRALQSPKVLTTLGSAINRGTASRITGTAIGTAVKSVQSQQTNQ